MTPDVLPPYTALLMAFIVGSCVGSFLNVCIYRIPRDTSILFPGSSCPVCTHAIPFYLNIPIISYFLLRGRCHHCHAPFSIRYPAVETLTALASMAITVRFGITAQGGVWFTFVCTLILIAFIDYDFQIIPDIISLPGIPLFALASILMGYHPWKDSLAGILVGGGSLYLVAMLYVFIRKEEGMGGGDIKLLAMIGAAIGWQGVFFTLFAGSLLGTLAGCVVMIMQRSVSPRLRIPFGPYLSMGAIAYIFQGKELIQWYFALASF